VLAFSIFNGFGGALLFTPSFAAVGHFFRARRGFATGFAASGGSLGGIIFPLMLRSLFESVGWAWSVRSVGFLCLGLCVISNIFIRSRLPPAVNANIHPDFTILRNRAFLYTTIGLFLLEFSLFIPLTYISSYMLANGFAEDFSYKLLPILNGASALGRVLPGYWGDKFGPFNSNIIAVLFSCIACLCIWLPAGSTTPGIVMFAILFGFASGNNISISPVCIGKLCKTQEYGRYYATAYTFAAVACLIGIPIGGNIISSQNGSYTALIIFTGVIYIGSFVALLAAKLECVGWKNIWARF
jgi:MFS family permease